MAEDGHLPLVVTCEWCDSDLATTRGHAFYDAMNHALDSHRTAVLADPDAAGRAFTVRLPGDRSRHRLRPERTQPHGWAWR